MSVRITAVTAEEAARRSAALSAILVDCVDGGASVGFLAPLAHGKAEAFWRGVIDGIASGERALFLAEDMQSDEILGTVQLVFAQMENQPHRAEISKLLVHRRSRGRGVGAALMRAAEGAALAAGRTVLVLDTATPEAERLYERRGWTRVGVVPGYALMPDGSSCDTIFYCKHLAQDDAAAA